MLTLRQKDLLDFIASYNREWGVGPSFDEMREALALRSKSGVHSLLRGLEERGFIRRLHNRARAVEVLSANERNIQIGRCASCGASIFKHNTEGARAHGDVGQKAKNFTRLDQSNAGRRRQVR